MADTAPAGVSLTVPTCWAPSNAIASIERICFQAFGCVQASGMDSVSPAAPVIVLALAAEPTDGEGLELDGGDGVGGIDERGCRAARHR